MNSTSTPDHQIQEPTQAHTDHGNVHENDHGHIHGPGCNHGHHHGEIAPYVRATPKVGANEPCPCGSGKKYKKCCRQ